MSSDAKFELAGLYARSGQWDKALPIWNALAQENVVCAMERLAIYHEHRKRDFQSALQWTERMLLQNALGDEVERRRARLMRKSVRHS